MGGVAKAVTKVVGSIFGGGKPRGGGSYASPKAANERAAAAANQTTTPAAPAAAAAAPAAANAPQSSPPAVNATTVGATATNTVGTMGAGNTTKSGRRRGRFETLLSDLGGAAERFGD